MTIRSAIGRAGEDLAVQYLTERGYRVCDRNFQKPWGELDIVAEKSGVTSFIEVKTSTHEGWEFAPELRANGTKLRKVIRTARTYLAYQKRNPETSWQIDIISVIFLKGRGKAKIRHFKNIDL